MQWLTARLSDHLVTLNAFVGLLRRKRAPVRSLSVTRGIATGETRLVVEVELSAAEVERLAQLCRRIVGVKDVRASTQEEYLMREIAVIRLAPGPDHHAELYDAISLYQGLILEESDEAMLVEVRGSGEFVHSFLRALEPFHISDVVRSEAVIARTGDAVTRSQPEANTR